ncbi:hypothetical protein O181_005640 [Austropuccinia psidii MF-1]|uniref:Uncharacterized protein n=1 Tax=Austropuccinia psidii MF-1 TaxID=1389203 RepID=A0A9Q3GG16_9BASI|nr:hypothetical protein [Austropuccinia psidii MF-1]
MTQLPCEEIWFKVKAEKPDPWHPNVPPNKFCCNSTWKLIQKPNEYLDLEAVRHSPLPRKLSILITTSKMRAFLILTGLLEFFLIPGGVSDSHQVCVNLWKPNLDDKSLAWCRDFKNHMYQCTLSSCKLNGNPVSSLLFTDCRAPFSKVPINFVWPNGYALAEATPNTLAVLKGQWAATLTGPRTNFAIGIGCPTNRTKNNGRVGCDGCV